MLCYACFKGHRLPADHDALPATPPAPAALRGPARLPPLPRSPPPPVAKARQRPPAPGKAAQPQTAPAPTPRATGKAALAALRATVTKAMLTRPEGTTLDELADAFAAAGLTAGGYAARNAIRKLPRKHSWGSVTSMNAQPDRTGIVYRLPS